MIKQNVTSMESLFKEIGYDWKNMKINEYVDVENLKFKILSLNHKTKNQEFSLIKKIIRKKDSTAYIVRTDANNFECSKDHKIAIKYNLLLEDFLYLEVNLINKKIPFYVLENNQWVKATIEKTNKKIPILDFELDNDHNYFSNNILSHNTIYGNPETTPGGLALKYYSSIRMEVRKSEWIEEGTGVEKKKVGFIANVKTVKNKVGIPFKKREMKIIFGKGLQVEDEFVDFALETGVIQRRGTWYFYGEERLGQGKDSAIATLKANKVLHAVIEKETRERISKIDLNTIPPIIETEEDLAELEKLENQVLTVSDEVLENESSFAHDDTNDEDGNHGEKVLTEVLEEVKIENNSIPEDVTKKERKIRKRREDITPIKDEEIADLSNIESIKE